MATPTSTSLRSSAPASFARAPGAPATPAVLSCFSARLSALPAPRPSAAPGCATQPRQQQQLLLHVVRAASGPGPQGKGPQRGRKGRAAAAQRGPDDTPLRDGNRDQLSGLLTERAAKTLLCYLQEMNPIVFQWLWKYMERNPIPRKNAPWDDISGDTFLRNLLNAPQLDTKMDLGKDALFDNTASIGVDPRQMAQRIMDIRVQLAREFMQDLAAVPDENSELLRETLTTSIESPAAEHPIPNPMALPRPFKPVVVHPELLDKDGKLLAEVASSFPELAKAMQLQQEHTIQERGRQQQQ